MKHKGRLLFLTAVLVFGTFIIAGGIVYQFAKEKVELANHEKLSQIRQFKSTELKNEFAFIKNALLITSESPSIKKFVTNYLTQKEELLSLIPKGSALEAQRQFLSDYYRLNKNLNVSGEVRQISPLAVYLQSEYIKVAQNQRNPLPMISNIPGSSASYFNAYEDLHPLMFEISKNAGLSDVLIVNAEGVVIYSVQKGLNFGDSLVSGPFGTSRMAQAYIWSTTAAHDASRFFDFAPVSYFLDRNAAFYGTPIYDNKKNFIGSLLFQIPIEKVDTILSNNQNWKDLQLGNSGEIIAFGFDGFSRNNSRLYVQDKEEFFKAFEKSVPSTLSMDTIKKNGSSALSVNLSPRQLEAYKAKRNIFSETTIDYLGTLSLQSVARLRIADDTEWIVIAKMSQEESLAVISLKQPYVLAFLTTFLLAAILISWFLYYKMYSPLAFLENRLKQLKDHDFNHRPLSSVNTDFEDFSAGFNQLADDFKLVLKNKDFLESVIQSLDEALFIVEVIPASNDTEKDQLIVLGINEATEDMLGIKNSAIQGTPLSNWLEIDHSIVATSWREDRESRKDFWLEGAIKQVQGGNLPIEVSWTRIQPSSSRIVLALCGTDIRWKKEFEKELHLKESVLKESQFLSRTGSFRWDVATGDCVWSEEEFSLFGLSTNEIIPNYSLFRSFILSEDLPLFDQALDEAHRNLAPFQVDLRVKRQDTHEIVWFRCRGRAEYDQGGNPIYIYIVTQDITELRRIEQSLIATKNEALKSSQAKSDFLAQMSHEIRTPMNAIMGMAELLKETKLDEDQKYYVTIFCKAGEVLMSLINDILDLSKIEAGQVSVENIPLDIKKMLSDVQSMMLSRVTEKRLQCTFEIDPDMNPYLMGDPTKLRQVVINLVSNGIKFTDKGSIHVSIKKNPNKKDHFLITVQDTGVGIPANKQHLIFQKFSQADNSITRKYGGTGLGLAISKSLVELMGGEIWFKSNEGQGTSFCVSLPYREQAYHPADLKSLSAQVSELDFLPLRQRDPAKKVRILIADDTEDNRTLFTHYLKNGPFEIIEAENGLQALDKIKSDEFDIVFMDVQMPEMDGYAATSEVRKWEKVEHKAPLPIIALTAHALAEDRQKSIRVGCNDHIAKPFKKDTLLGVINRYSL